MNLKIKILIVGLAFLGIAFQGYSSTYERVDEKPATMKVFPNPVVDGTLSIDSDSKIEKIEILSIVGQVVYIQEPEPSNSVRLYLDNIKTGVYLIKVSFEDNTSDTKRIWVK